MINNDVYRIAGNFRGVLIFVIFVTIPRVTKFSTHEIFHPRIFSRLLRIYIYIGLRESRNLKPRKLILKTRDSFSRKFAPPKITRYTVPLKELAKVNRELLKQSPHIYTKYNIGTIAVYHEVVKLHTVNPIFLGPLFPQVSRAA